VIGQLFMASGIITRGQEGAVVHPKFLAMGKLLGNLLVGNFLFKVQNLSQKAPFW